MIDETIFVKQAYDSIASDFSNTRVWLWNFVKTFLIDKADLQGLDIGCGNGKNMIYDNIIGIDNCDKLLSICNKRNKNVILSDCCYLPFNNSTFDYVMCISMLHHLSTANRREDCFFEMLRVLKKGGCGIINVWSYEYQEKRSFCKGDNFVPWKSRDKKQQIQRYYYIMSYDMFIEFVNAFKTYIHVDAIFNEKGNWVLKFTKN